MKAQLRTFEPLPFVAGLLLFLMLDPYITWAYQSLMFFAVTLPLLGIFWLKQRVMNVRNTLLFVFFALILLLAAVCKRSNLFGLIAFFLFAIIPFMSRSFTKAVYRNFRNIYVVVIFLGLVVWVLVSLHVPIPHKIIPPMNTWKEYYYDCYPFLVIPHEFVITIETIYASFKFCGPFDEPGVVGTISFLMLLIDKFRLKDKKTLVIFISGLLSFSLFFYMAAFVYLLYFIYFHRKWLLGIVLVSSLATAYVTTYDNPFLDQMLWGRIQWNKEKKSISGDNRSDIELNNYFEKVKGTNIYYFGSPDHKLLTYFSGNASYKNAVLTYGMVSCALYLVFFTLLALLRIGFRKELFLFLGILVLTLYQRPSFFSINYIFLFVMLVTAYSATLRKKPLRLVRRVRIPKKVEA